MNQIRNTNLPIVGMVQHGMQIATSNGGKRAKELGYFIAKVQDNNMQKFLQKFDEQYKGKQYIEIEFFDDNPLTKKFVRYNQGGDVCHCLEGNSTGNQKIKNGWQPIECNIETCQYRQKNEQGKTACNRIGWLKFFIPTACQDRIWLMKITGQKSINNLDAYINLQKAKGNALNGKYILFLKQEEQTSKFTGQTFNNYVLDIVKKEDFISNNPIPQINQKQEILSTENAKDVNNDTVKQESNNANITNITSTTTATQIEDKAVEEKASKKTSTTTKSKSKKTKETKPKEDTSKVAQIETSNTEDSLDNCYGLLSTSTEIITNKSGEQKEYLVGEFVDMKDQISKIVVRPEDAVELAECNLGTFVRLDIVEKKGRKFAVKLEFIEKMLKKVAA